MVMRPVGSGRKYLSVREVLDRYAGRVSDRTLRRWRATGAGPNWLSLGSRVFYPLEELERWEERRRRERRG